MRATSPAMRFSRKRAAFLIVAFSAASRLGVAEQLLDLRATAQATRDLLLAQDVLAAHVGAAALLDECRRADEQTEGGDAEADEAGHRTERSHPAGRGDDDADDGQEE